MKNRILLLLLYFLSTISAQNTSLSQNVISSGAVSAQSEQTKLNGLH